VVLRVSCQNNYAYHGDDWAAADVLHKAAEEGLGAQVSVMPLCVHISTSVCLCLCVCVCVCLYVCVFVCM